VYNLLSRRLEITDDILHLQYRAAVFLRQGACTLFDGHVERNFYLANSNNANHSSSRVHVPPQATDDPRPSQCESPRLHASHFRWHRPRQFRAHQKSRSSRQGSVYTPTPLTRQAIWVHRVCQRAEPLQVSDLCHEEQLATGSVPSPPDYGALPQAYITNGTQHGAQECSMGPYKVLSSSQMTAGEILKSLRDLYNFLTL